MKIEEQVLSIEQMKHLRELGVDTSDASMCWVADNEGESEEDWYVTIPNNFLMPYNTIPTYTIGDLIEKLPKRIGIYHLFIDWDRMQYISWSWQETIFRSYFNFKDKPFINALYDCLCWVAENHKELLEAKK